MLMLAGLLVPACRQAHDSKSGQHKCGPQRGHHPCHRAGVPTPYISGELPSSLVPLSLLVSSAVSSGAAAAAAPVLFTLCNGGRHRARHTCQVTFRLPLSL